MHIEWRQCQHAVALFRYKVKLPEAVAAGSFSLGLIARALRYADGSFS